MRGRGGEGPSDRFEAPLVFDVHTPRACEVAARWTAGVGAGEESHSGPREPDVRWKVRFVDFLKL